MTTAGKYIQSLHEVNKIHAALNAEKHLWLVKVMLRRFPHKDCEGEDLYQQGCLGLMKALARYDPERGSSFTAYAASMIIGEMRMYTRLTAPIHISRTEKEQRARIEKAISMLTAKLSREPTMQELSSVLRIDPEELALLMEEISVISADAETENGTPILETLSAPEDWLSAVEFRDILRRLSNHDQNLIRYRCIEGFTQAETAQRLGCTQVYVSRRERVLKRILRDEWRSSQS